MLLLKRHVFLPSVALVVAAACGVPTAPNPFVPDAGTGGGTGGGAGEDGGVVDAGPDADPTLGGPCLDDGQCNDSLDCTFDRCDMDLKRCRFTPDDSLCQNGVFCDGQERCVNNQGCKFGDPVDCGDKNSCTIDRCDEPTQSCQHAPRDVDGDGDPDIHCSGGHDCDDSDPTRASTLPEICGNQKDDDCDGEVDEADCTTPLYDSCVDPLVIDAPGTYALNTTAATFDYPTSCGLGASPNTRDVVAALVLPAGLVADVEVTARTQGIPVSVAIAGQCGDPATELACSPAYPYAYGQLAKVLARGLGDPAQEKAYPVYVSTSPGAPVTLDVLFNTPPTPKPTNETCGTAQPIALSTPTPVPIFDATMDLASNCNTPLGDLVYSFTLPSDADVDVYAVSVDLDGTPRISLRGPGCSMPEDEIACQSAISGHVFRHNLPAGTYYVALSASAPTTLLLTVEASAPTIPPFDEDCSNATSLAINETIAVPLAGHQDDVSTGCMAGAIDAAYPITLPFDADVLLIERIAAGDSGSIALMQPMCGGPQDVVFCATGAPSPVRGRKHNVPAGDYAVIVESTQGQPTQATVIARPAVPPVLVPFADGCADAVVIPESGGFYQGTTANATADFSAGCDQGGQPPGGAPDQLFKLVLTATRRVVLTMEGSGYNTLLDVREGPACPGDEVPLGCTVGYQTSRSFLDLTLAAGTYFIQVDGANGDKGPWFLDVFVVDP